MKKFYILILFSCVLSISFSQTSADSLKTEKWKNEILNDQNLDATEHISELQDVDLSALLKTDASDQPLGFISDNYERFDIFFTSVKKNDARKNEYLITGKTRVKQNVCDFKGTINLTSAKYYIHKSDLGNYPDSIHLGILIGTYLFEEDPTQPHTGKLQGFLAVRYYVTSGNKILIDDWNNTNNNYSNQQYVGSWISYDGRKIQQCNWGSYRIPASGDLDIGKNEFSPSDKYKANGWEKYPSLFNTIWWK
ncbi:MAG: hypothetical protein JWN78_2957 [Bacteroidota bacterium]|nr:hypothetical protein [Bacteroidota bacterium]